MPNLVFNWLILPRHYTNSSTPSFEDTQAEVFFSQVLLLTLSHHGPFLGWGCHGQGPYHSWYRPTILGFLQYLFEITRNIDNFLCEPNFQSFYYRNKWSVPTSNICLLRLMLLSLSPSLGPLRPIRNDSWIWWSSLDPELVDWSTIFSSRNQRQHCLIFSLGRSISFSFFFFLSKGRSISKK